MVHISFRLRETVFTLMSLIAAMPVFPQTTDNATMTIDNDNTVAVEIKTTMGDITMMLFNDTPLHRDNFARLVGEGYYDGLLFHRVIPEFMAQTGDPFSRTASPGQMLGDGGPDYLVDAEIIYPGHFHRYGAVAAARQSDEVNPERRSSGSQFYIVTGKKYTVGQLKSMERKLNREREMQVSRRLNEQYRDSIMSLRKARDFSALTALQDEIIEKTDAEMRANPFRFPAEVSEVYTTEGGIPHLDGEYTVFGQVIKGMDVVEKITQQPTDGMARPLEDVRILSVKIISGQ